jgi:ferredoxin--NADP+ reductase
MPSDTRDTSVGAGALVGTSDRPLRVAVVGAGPAGFYTVEALVKHKQIQADVDLFDRLPAPYGLVRYGVAPDHQKIKSVTVAYDRLGENPRVRFFGNVHVGHGDISVEELTRHYDQVVFAVGCETDRRLGIEGEDLRGSHPATSFVAWYNGHPDFRDYAVELDAERAVVVGVGDVGMDIARMLVKGAPGLEGTDIAAHAHDVFRQSNVREIVVLGRRGPGQAAFAAKELEDIVDLPDVAVDIDHSHVRTDLDSGEALENLQRRKLEYLATLAAKPKVIAAKRVVFRFLTSPVEILGEGGRVTGVKIEHNEVVRDDKGRFVARGTGRFETIAAGLVFRSVGYRGVAIDGLPFDEKQGIVPNRDGRVLKNGEVWPNVYVSGWIKRGPSGVIGTNKSDAAATVQKMAEDLAGRADPGGTDKTRNAVDTLLRERGVRPVTFASWKRLDQLEKERGAKVGKVREKFIHVDDMLSALKGPVASDADPNPT